MRTRVPEGSRVAKLNWLLPLNREHPVGLETLTKMLIYGAVTWHRFLKPVMNVLYRPPSHMERMTTTAVDIIPKYDVEYIEVSWVAYYCSSLVGFVRPYMSNRSDRSFANVPPLKCKETSSLSLTAENCSACLSVSLFQRCLSSHSSVGYCSVYNAPSIYFHC